MRARFSRFMDKAGYYLLALLCTLVIVGASAFTYAMNQESDDKEAPVNADRAQRLSDVIFSEVAATPAPEIYALPVKGKISRSFSGHAVFFASTNAWQQHNAIDLLCEYGEKVCAALDGTVTKIEKNMYGAYTVILSHKNAVKSEYAGLLDVSGKIGDSVRAGGMLGHAGGRIPNEGDDLPHIHFALYQGGEAADPALFLPLE